MSLNNNNPFAGKRYIALVRASDDKDGDNSTKAQLKWAHAESQRLEMHGFLSPQSMSSGRSRIFSIGRRRGWTVWWGRSGS